MQAPASLPALIRFGPFQFDSRTQELLKRGRRIKLHGQPAQILAVLLEHSGEMVTRDELRRQLWPADTFVDFDHVLNTGVKKLRAVLADSADHPRFIETLPKRGYRFIAPVIRADVDTEEAQQPRLAPEGPAVRAGAERSGPQPGHERTGRAALAQRIAIPALAVPVLLAALIGLKVGGWRERSPGRARTGRIESLAVLPLENLSGDVAQDYFADGITEALITDLAQIGALRVISRTSVMHYKGTRRTLPEIARELKVDAVVEGAALRSGNRVRITAQLIEARTDRHIWAQTYERDLRDIVAIQGEVARAIADEIQIRLTAQERARLASARPINPEASEAYLRGRYFWNKRTEEGVKKGIEYFDRATQLDPNYAVAYAGLAESYIVLNGYRFLAPTRAFPRVNAAALKALELDERLAEAHMSLGDLKWEYDWDKSGAEKEFRRAIELNPNYATAHQWYAEALAEMGREKEALAEIKRAQELDPLSLPISSVAGWIFYLGRHYDQAIEQYRRTLEMDPNFAPAHLYLGRAHVQKGSFEQAIIECQKATTLSESHPFYMAWLAYADARAGKRGNALRILHDLKAVSRHKYIASHDIAAIYAGLGEQSQAIAWLERAYDERSYTVLLLEVEPEFDSLRSDRRFRGLARRVGASP